MFQSSGQEPTPSVSKNVQKRIEELLQHQRYAVSRASSIGMSAEEAKGMHARIDELGELLAQILKESA